MDRWERRARKLEAKRRKMKVTGRGLVTVIHPLIKRKAEEAKRAGKEQNPPARAAA